MWKNISAFGCVSWGRSGQIVGQVIKVLRCVWLERTELQWVQLSQTAEGTIRFGPSNDVLAWAIAEFMRSLCGSSRIW
jgi:hypothetical protein